MVSQIVGHSASANDPGAGDARALAIAKRSDDSDLGFHDSVVSATMILRNTAGQATIRKFQIKTLEEVGEDIGEKSLIVFESPRDIAGTALLSHAGILDSDDQWLYLPALKRTKRISSANKSGAFVGSEFSFEDFTLSELHKFRYVFVGQDKLDGVAVNIIDRIPLYAGSGYSRQRAWLGEDDSQLRRVEFYDPRDQLLKTLVLSEIRRDGSFLRAHRLLMTNHQSRKETEIVYDAFNFGNGLDRNDFSVGILNQIR